jgi:PAS domain S-box-containing protein
MLINFLLRRFQTRTINRDLALGLGLLVSITLVGVGITAYFISAADNEQTLTTQAAETVNKLADILSVPLWNLDTATLQQIAEAYRHSENVAAVSVIDENGNMVYTSATAETGLLIETRPIQYRGQLIGRVTLSFSRRGLRGIQRDTLFFTSVAVLCVLAAVVVASRLLLRQFLDRPLARLTHSLDLIAGGDYDHLLQPVPQADINAIVSKVNMMAAQIAARDETLRHSEEHFRALIENASDIIMVLGQAGAISYISPASERTLGYAPGQLTGKNPLDLLHPDDQERAQQAFASATPQSTPAAPLLLRLRHASGAWRILEATAHNLPDEIRSRGEVVVNLRDVTERVQAEATLRQRAEELASLNEAVRLNAVELEQRVIARTAALAAVNRELESFAYSVSHDLRSPLRHIDGFSRILLEDHARQLDPEGLHYLRRVSENAKYMDRLIEGILQLSRATRGEIWKETVDLSQLARDLAQELADSDPKRQVTWVIEPDQITRGDTPLLKSVLGNLLDNAWKFSSTKATATIEFGRRVDETAQQPANITGPVYFVRDNGAGFDMTFADKLFGAFQRLHPQDEFPGTGIGLATVQRIIHRYGGTIWAESIVGQGATFFFTLGG